MSQESMRVKLEAGGGEELGTEELQAPAVAWPRAGNERSGSSAATYSVKYEFTTEEPSYKCPGVGTDWTYRVNSYREYIIKQDFTQNGVKEERNEVRDHKVKKELMRECVKEKDKEARDHGVKQELMREFVKEEENDVSENEVKKQLMEKCDKEEDQEAGDHGVKQDSMRECVNEEEIERMVSEAVALAGLDEGQVAEGELQELPPEIAALRAVCDDCRPDYNHRLQMYYLSMNQLNQAKNPATSDACSWASTPGDCSVSAQTDPGTSVSIQTEPFPIAPSDLITWLDLFKTSSKQ